MSDKEQKNNNYKITNQSGLYHRSDMSKIVDDTISDDLVTRIVKFILSGALLVQLIGGLYYHICNPVSLTVYILALVAFIIAGIINSRINIILTFHSEEKEAFDLAIKHRKAFVILRFSTFTLSIVSIILFIIGY